MNVEIIGKKQIADAIRSRTASSEEDAKKIIELTLESIRDELGSGKKVHLGNLATLSANGSASSEVHDDALIEAIASRGSLDRGKVKAAFQVAMEHIRESLLTGAEVQLPSFASISVSERKAKIIRDPKSGQKMIAPSRKVLQFNADAALLSALQNQAVTFVPSQDMQDRLARMKTATILLVVPDYDFFVKTIEYHFNRAGWKVEVAVSKDQSTEKLASGAYLIILDAGMNGAQDVAEHVKCRIDTSLIPLIMMYPKGTDTKRPDKFRICGDEQVIQPFEVKNLLTLAETELARASEEEAIFRQEVTFQLPTDDESIDRANEMAKKLFEHSGLEDKDQVALCAAFREALGNAAQHGNKHRRDKPLEVLYLLDNEKITIAVTDSGQGFDHQKYLDQGKQGNVLQAARESHKAGKLGGLGIMLMLKCVDKLEYNDKGNVITLTKYLRSSKDS